MTSFELYTKYRNVGGGDRASLQREYANKVLMALWNESLCKNNIFSNIEFISIVKKMIVNAKFYRNIDESRIYIFDAYVFLNALCTCVYNKEFSCDAIVDDNLNYLFKQVQLDDFNRINFLNNTNTIISKIEMRIRMDIDYEGMNYTKTKSDEAVSETFRDKDSMTSFSSNGLGTGKMKGSHQKSTLKSTEGSLLGEKSKKIVEKSDSVFKTKRTVEYTDLKGSVRRKANKEVIDKWHSEIEDISSTLKTIQPDVSKMLENIMGFSDKITEKYVLQFARMQIELYNFISDNYMYHKSASEQSGNQDYINAVSNYEEFLYSISDALAVFGIEEISSCPGDSFDGKIHEAESNDFSSRRAIIKKCIRSGYRYKDVIIQKEKVEI